MSLASLVHRALDTIGLTTRAAANLAVQTEKFNQHQASGIKNTLGQFQLEESEKLRGVKRFATYREMEANEHVKSALKDQMLPLVSADWSYKPASDKAIDKQVACFLNATLLRKCEPDAEFGMEYWTDRAWKAERLPAIGRKLLFGFAMFHKRYRQVGSRVVIDLRYLEPESVDPYGWDLDDDDKLLSIKRTFTTPKLKFNVMKPIPANELVLYPHEGIGARYEGRAFVRSMFGAWYRYDLLVRYQTMWGSRVGAPNPMGLYPSDWDENPQVMARWKEFVMSGGRGQAPELGFFFGPMGKDAVEPKIIYPGADSGSASEVDRLGTLIDREARGIAHVGGRRSQMVNDSPNGSRSSGETMASNEDAGVKALADEIIEFEMHGFSDLNGLGWELTQLNFANARNPANLAVENLRPDEKMNRGAKLSQSVKDGVLPKHPLILQQIGKAFELDLPDDVYEFVQTPPPPPDPRGNGQGGAPSPSDPEQDPNAEPGDDPSAEDPAKDKGSAYAALADDVAALKRLPEGSKVIHSGGGGAKPRGWFRAPTPFEEQFVSLGTIERELSAFEQRYYAAAAPVIRKMEADLIDRVKRGIINAGNYSNLRKGDEGPSLKYRASLKNALATVLQRTKRFGVEQVKEEIAAQRAHAKTQVAA